MAAWQLQAMEQVVVLQVTLMAGWTPRNLQQRQTAEATPRDLQRRQKTVGRAPRILQQERMAGVFLQNLQWKHEEAG